MAVSVFDLFKIGIGPSSSHTVGPMRAARMFALRLDSEGLLPRTARVLSQLYGSLGATGKGHGSDKAVLLGLAGHEPDTVDVDAVPALLAALRHAARLPLLGRHDIAFSEKDDLKFFRRETLPFHANGLRFTAFDAAGAELASRVYYSVGGGFVVSEEVAADGQKQKVIAPDTTSLPHPFHSGDELLLRCRELDRQRARCPVSTSSARERWHSSPEPFNPAGTAMTHATRFLTTHVGSLPRSQDVVDQIFAREKGEPVDEATFDAVMAAAVDDVVHRQVQAGIDIVSDGEMSKISYATYIKDRYTGFDGDSPRRTPADLLDYPGFMKRLSTGGGTPSYRRPCCTGPIAMKDGEPLRKDIAHVQAAAAKHGAKQVFMNAASPGVVSLFQPNQHYANDDDYLEALAHALRHEYHAIVDAGLILQLDSPDLGLGRHMMYKDLEDAAYLARIERHVEALNLALVAIPADRVRMHVCWGNYEGPHHKDVPLATILPTVMKAKPQGLLFETSNPRHAHEWETVQKMKHLIPDNKVLIPGVLDSTTNFVEHPRLVAQRIERFAEIVGRDRVMAGTDCGFGTFAGFGAVDADIVYAKFAAMAEGAAMASRQCWS